MVFKWNKNLWRIWNVQKNFLKHFLEIPFIFNNTQKEVSYRYHLNLIINRKNSYIRFLITRGYSDDSDALTTINWSKSGKICSFHREGVSAEFMPLLMFKSDRAFLGNIYEICSKESIFESNQRRQHLHTIYTFILWQHISLI